MKKLISLLLMLLILTSCSEKTYSGKLEYSNNASDKEFSITVDTPILIREVEMVQYYKDEEGVRMVLANYPIESFEDNGNTYTNPDFNTDITSEIFYNDVSLQGYELSDEAIYKLVNSDTINLIKFTDLNEEMGIQHGLTIVDGSYVTASDDWQLGDIKVTYYYLDPSCNYAIEAKLKDGVLN